MLAQTFFAFDTDNSLHNSQYINPTENIPIRDSPFNRIITNALILLASH